MVLQTQVYMGYPYPNFCFCALLGPHLSLDLKPQTLRFIAAVSLFSLAKTIRNWQKSV